MVTVCIAQFISSVIAGFGKLGVDGSVSCMSGYAELYYACLSPLKFNSQSMLWFLSLVLSLDLTKFAMKATVIKWLRVRSERLAEELSPPFGSRLRVTSFCTPAVSRDEATLTFRVVTSLSHVSFA